MTQLDQSSVLALLYERGAQHANGYVRFAGLPDEFSLIGFIPVYASLPGSSCFSGIDLAGEILVTTHFIRFSSLQVVYPIFRDISKTEGNDYLVDSNLLLNSLIDNVDSLSYFRGESSLKFGSPGSQILTKIKIKAIDNFFFKKEEENVYFIGNKNFFVLQNGPGKWQCISNDFLCLCTYMNKTTGKIDYVATSPDLTIRAVGNNKEEENVKFVW